MSEKNKTLLLAAAIAIVPSTIGAFLSYFSSKSDQTAGYARIAETVGQQGKILEELVKEVNYLRGRADGDRTHSLRIDSNYTTMHSPENPVPLDSKERVLRLRPLPAQFKDVQAK